ncbi:DUF4031 domain-containing protein [Pseudomonas sp. NY15364]|uniref:DUF4031 domain-containing protein n=1 Tax=Pseudomonas sp. NY15364 TaxID=3400353 RepID=UPI003A851F66
MAVYVDDERMPYRRMLMCHMLADTTEELLEMADKIGVQRRWLQHSGTPKEHFDICLSKRAKALQHGALDADRAKVVEIIRTKRERAAGGQDE